MKFLRCFQACASSPEASEADAPPREAIAPERQENSELHSARAGQGTLDQTATYTRDFPQTERLDETSVARADCGSSRVLSPVSFASERAPVESMFTGMPVTATSASGPILLRNAVSVEPLKCRLQRQMDQLELKSTKEIFNSWRIGALSSVRSSVVSAFHEKQVEFDEAISRLKLEREGRNDRSRLTVSDLLIGRCETEEANGRQDALRDATKFSNQNVGGSDDSRVSPIPVSNPLAVVENFDALRKAVNNDQGVEVREDDTVSELGGGFVISDAGISPLPVLHGMSSGDKSKTSNLRSSGDTELVHTRAVAPPIVETVSTQRADNPVMTFGESKSVVFGESRGLGLDLPILVSGSARGTSDENVRPPHSGRSNRFEMKSNLDQLERDLESLQSRIQTLSKRKTGR